MVSTISGRFRAVVEAEDVPWSIFGKWISRECDPLSVGMDAVVAETILVGTTIEVEMARN